MGDVSTNVCAEFHHCVLLRIFKKALGIFGR